MRAILLAALCTLPVGATETWPLDTGTTIMLVEDHRVPLVHVRVEFPAGTWSPWVREHGAREAFEAQASDPDGRMRARMDDLGTRVDLEVTDRASAVSASCLPDLIDQCVGLIRDVLFNRDFDPADIARRWQRRRLEWSAARKEPDSRGLQEAARVVFPAGDPRRTAYEKPRRAHVSASRLADVRDELIRAPGRVVAFAGDLDRARAQSLATALLPAASERDAPRAGSDLPEVIPSNSRARMRTAELPRLTQIYFALVRESLGCRHPDYPAFLVADHVLGGHFYSRLSVALRHGGGDTYGAFSKDLGGADVGLYVIGTYTRTANAASAEAKLHGVLARFGSEGITEAERADAIGYLKGTRARSRQSPLGILERALLEHRLGVPEGYLDEAVDRAAEIPLEEINRFIARYYDAGAFSMVRVVPEAGHE
jgi:predicted Zn-dependent peptidase